jgi:hypothetical protein
MRVPKLWRPAGCELTRWEVEAIGGSSSDYSLDIIAFDTLVMQLGMNATNISSRPMGSPGAHVGASGEVLLKKMGTCEYVVF